MLDVDEFYRTGSPSINLGFAHPETRTSSIMDFKVCKANIARTQTEATVFIDWADCCCCCVLFVHSFHLVCLILCHVSCPAPVDTRFSTRTIKTSRYCGRARASPIWDTQVSSFAHFFFANLTPTHSLIHFSLFLFFGFDCRSNLAHVTRTQRFLIGNSHDNPWCVDQIGTGSRTTGAQQEPELSENTLREHLILYLALNYIYKTRIKLL